eukprot:s239_g7.t1
MAVDGQPANHFNILLRLEELAGHLEHRYRIQSAMAFENQYNVYRLWRNLARTWWLWAGRNFPAGAFEGEEPSFELELQVVLQAPTPPAVTRAPGATRKLDAERPPSPPNLRDAAYKVLAYRKEQGNQPEELQTLPAEPCLAALVQLVEDIVYGVPQEHARCSFPVAQLHHLFVDLNRQPPHLEDKKRRVRRLLEAMTFVDQLANVCQYMGPMTRLSYDELHAQVLEELWLARSMVGLDTLLRHWA